MASRTLVKSPPELWAECSDAASLARHLDQFGEIKITRLDPETAVAWEGERARGTVRIEPAGWGTRVILTAVAVATGEEQDEVPAAAELTEVVEPVVAEPVVVEPVVVEPVVVEPEVVEPEVVEPEVVEPEVAEPEVIEPEVIEPEPATAPPRRRRLARLFRFRREPPPAPAGRERRVEPEHRIDRKPPAQTEAGPIPESEPTPEPTPEAISEPTPEAISDPTPEAISDPSPEATFEPTPETVPEPTVSETAPEATEAALTAALDSLGQAHHRPYSRA